MVCRYLMGRPRSFFAVRPARGGRTHRTRHLTRRMFFGKPVQTGRRLPPTLRDTPMIAPDLETAADRLRDLVASSNVIVPFTGAGISTECGIPDFRSPGGFWTRFKPIEFADFLASEERRMEAWRRYFMIRETFGDVKPGRGHHAIARLAHMGKVSHVITQNIDDLHRASGVPPDRIIELHGNGTYAKCLTCETRHELDWVRSEIAAQGRPPPCTVCAGLIKAATISFGQPMPEDAMA